MRLIDADAFFEDFSEVRDYEWVSQEYEVDAVPVVRCGECKWWDNIGCAIRIVDESDKPKADDYCSFGERRDDEID